MLDKYFNNIEGFSWDDGNLGKNWIKHKVSQNECEQVFFNLPLIVSPDVKHSYFEKRFYILGATNFKRKLFIAFTIRNKLIRVISARDMTKKEKKIFDEKIKKNTGI